LLGDFIVHPDKLFEKYGMTDQHIAEAAKRAIARKR
jgi:hypothetical protein